VLQGLFIWSSLVWTQFNKDFETYTEILAHVVNDCGVFQRTFGEAVSFITHFSYHLVKVSVSVLIHEIKITSLAVAFHSAFNCSIVATIHCVNNAHSQLLIATLVALLDKFDVSSEKITLFVGIVHVFRLYTASHIAFGFRQYEVIMMFYKYIKKLGCQKHTEHISLNLWILDVKIRIIKSLVLQHLLLNHYTNEHFIIAKSFKDYQLIVGTW